MLSLANAAAVTNGGGAPWQRRRRGQSQSQRLTLSRAEFGQNDAAAAAGGGGRAKQHQQRRWMRSSPASPPAAATTAESSSSSTSRLSFVEAAPADPILGVTEAFLADSSPEKLNLGVGAFRTDELKPYVLKVVKEAERRMLEADENKEYLPIQGLAAFNAATVELILGKGNTAVAEGRVATIQSLSGTGSLRVGAAFIQRFLPETTVYLSDPTWGNHKSIFADAGVPTKTYRYFDPNTIGLDFEGMKSDIAAAPEGSVIILHGCAHNPTGIDPTPEQWEELALLIKSKGHFPFFDVAYQGFASGSLDTDAFSVRLFESKGIELMVSQSYSKNLGLYAERIGALNVVLASQPAAERTLSQLKRLARAMYSNPPVHGARIAATVIGDSELFEQWNGEMEYMAGRIKGVRQLLYDKLTELNKDRDWSFILSQIGMFSYSGMTVAQVENITSKWHIYMTKNGRISLAGLSAAKTDYLARAIDDSVRNA